MFTVSICMRVHTCPHTYAHTLNYVRYSASLANAHEGTKSNDRTTDEQASMRKIRAHDEVSFCPTSRDEAFKEDYYRVDNSSQRVVS
jgi:hypothetical protein